MLGTRIHRAKILNPFIQQEKTMNQNNYKIIPLMSLVFGFLGIVIFGGALLLITILNLNTIMAFNSQSIVFIAIMFVFLIFFMLSLLVTVYCQGIIITDKEITVKKLNKMYSLQYDEISYCYINSGNINIGNNNKQISFPSFEYWNGKNKQQAITLMIQSLSERKIEPKMSIKGMFPRIKGFNN